MGTTQKPSPDQTEHISLGGSQHTAELRNTSNNSGHYSTSGYNPQKLAEVTSLMTSEVTSDDEQRGTPSPHLQDDSGIVTSCSGDSAGESPAKHTDPEPPPTEARDGSGGRHVKPQHSYIALISMAILESPQRKLLLGDIYKFIQDKFPFYKHVADKAWRNSIRHNLSLNECFMKNGRADNGKGNYWSIHPACVKDFSQGDFRRRQARRRARRGAAQPTTPAQLAQRYQLGYVPMSSVYHRAAHRPHPYLAAHARMGGVPALPGTWPGVHYPVMPQPSVDRPAVSFGSSVEASSLSKDSSHASVSGHPTTGLPTTGLPATGLPTTSLPTTGLPTTGLPTTGLPTTGLPTTSLPTTGLPTTGLPTTALPATSFPATGLPATGLPATFRSSDTPTYLPDNPTLMSSMPHYSSLAGPTYLPLLSSSMTSSLKSSMASPDFSLARTSVAQPASSLYSGMTSQQDSYCTQYSALRDAIFGMP